MSLRQMRGTVERLAAGLGATVAVDRAGSVLTILVDAPEGKVWTDGVVTALRIEGRPTCNADLAQMWQDAFDRISAGLEDQADEPPYEPTVPADASVEDILAAWRKL